MTHPPASASAMPTDLSADVLIVGAGIAGICCLLELLEQNHQQGSRQQIILVDRDHAERMGGWAVQSFGGIFAVDTPEQRRAGISDCPALAWQDWCSYGEMTPDDPDMHWGVAWGRHYVHDCRAWVYDWLRLQGIKFLPMPLWVERGLHGGGRSVSRGGGNSVPRWHVVWGTGKVLMETLIQRLYAHPLWDCVRLYFEIEVTDLLRAPSSSASTDPKAPRPIIGCRGRTNTQTPIEIHATSTVIAAGGFSNNLDMVRQHWHADQQPAPTYMLSGAHPYADGQLHKVARQHGANLTHLDHQWNYAAGVHHWQPQKPLDGISLVPCKSALWLDANGRRIGPAPLVSGYDTRDLVTQLCRSPASHSWQVLNYKIAKKEFAASGAAFNSAIRAQSWLGLIYNMLCGNAALVDEFIEHCIDIVTADTLPELVTKMNALQGEPTVDAAALIHAVTTYDAEVSKPLNLQNDEQIRRIAALRQWRGDQLRTCHQQPINDPNAGPLMAIRVFIISRKSMGGIQTDLSGQVLAAGSGMPIQGLYAIGEASGFGGGGMTGKRSLEGTFLGGCIYSGRRTAQALATHSQSVP